MTSHSQASTRAAAHQVDTQPLQQVARLVGAVFLLVGVLGFVPGITTNYDQLSFGGHHSGALLLGIFAVSVLHNLVHLGFGVAGLTLGRTWSGARAFLVGGGVVYLVLAAYGAVVDHGSGANFVPINSADNWLHLALGGAMVGLGIVLGRKASPTTTG